MVLVLALASACKPNATPPKPADGHVFVEQPQGEKLNAYVVAYNRLLDRHDFSDILRDYRQSNPRVGKAGAVLDSYSIRGEDVDRPLEAFHQAQALNQPLPELDEPAKVLVAALEKLNPLLKDAEAYQTQQTYRVDKGAKAHAMDAGLVAALIDADRASGAFSAALSAQTLKRDEARLAKLAPGGVAYHKLKVSLEIRKLGTAVDAALEDKTKAPALQARLQAVIDANAALGTLKPDPKAEPAWDPVCAMYKEKVDGLIGATNALIAAFSSGSRAEVGSAYDDWFKLRNESVEAANACGG
jgi:hypothetical protein